MKQRLVRSLIALLSCITFISGCSKPSKVDPVAADALKQPAAAEVMAAIEKKDYDGAMAQLMKLRQAATTDEQQKQYAVVAFEARQKFSEAAGTDPKAAEAAATLRALSIGR
jgi:hypothetical protein